MYGLDHKEGDEHLLQELDPLHMGLVFMLGNQVEEQQQLQHHPHLDAAAHGPDEVVVANCELHGEQRHL